MCGTVSVGCETDSQALSLSSAVLLLPPWTEVILGWIGETGEIAPIIYLPKSTLLAFPILCPQLQLRLGDLICAFLAPGSAWRREVDGAWLAVLWQIPLCSWGRHTAPQAESLPLLVQKKRGKRLWCESSGVGECSSSRWWKGKWGGGGGVEVNKEETQAVLLTGYFEHVLKLSMLNFYFRKCLAPSIQPGIKLAHRKRSCRVNAGEAHTSEAMVGMKTGDVPLTMDLYLREVGTIIYVSAPSVCNNKSLSQAPSNPSSVSS